MPRVCGWSTVAAGDGHIWALCASTLQGGQKVEGAKDRPRVLGQRISKCISPICNRKLLKIHKSIQYTGMTNIRVVIVYKIL